MGCMEESATSISRDVSLPRAPVGAVVVDIVYGLPPDSSTGGCVVQRTFEDDLRAVGVSDVRLHVASTAASAERVFERLQEQESEEGGEEGRSRVLIIDGIALLFLRHKLPALRNPAIEPGGNKGGRRRLLVGFVHCPFSQPFYCKEPWLRAAVTEEMLLGADGKGLHDEEARLFGLLDKVIVVGKPCELLLTADYGVAEDAIILLEPTFPTPTPPPADDNVGEVSAPAPPPPPSLALPLTLSAEAGASATAAAEAEAVAAATVAATGAREAASRLPGALRFSSVGTLCPRKGQLELVRAFRTACASHPTELGGSVLTLIGGEEGDPDYAAAVTAAAAAPSSSLAEEASADSGGVQSNVCLLGSLPHDQTLEVVAESDAFLLNSCLESWAVAPVEAALRGVPVLSTRVGTLDQTLPPEPTIWVGSGGQAGGGADALANGGENAGGDVGGALASIEDWRNALLQFAQARRRLKLEAARAVPNLVQRFGQAAAGSRARAVYVLIGTARGWGAANPPRPPSLRRKLAFLAAGQLDRGVGDGSIGEESVVTGSNGVGTSLSCGCSNGSGHCNESVHSKGFGHSNGSGHPNGYVHSNGSVSSKGSVHSNGSVHSKGPVHPKGSVRSNGSVHNNVSGGIAVSGDSNGFGGIPVSMCIPVAGDCNGSGGIPVSGNIPVAGDSNGCVNSNGSGDPNGSNGIPVSGDSCCAGSKSTSSSGRVLDTIPTAAVIGSDDQERVRRATVMHALACVCAAALSVCDAGGPAGGLAALVGAQVLLLVTLAPTPSPANVVTIFRSFIPPAVVWWKAGSDFGQVEVADVFVFGAIFVLLDVVDGALARRSKSGPTRVGAALDVESDSLAVLFLSLAAARKAWRGGFIAGILRYLFVLATGARELPPSPIGPAGRWLAKVAALASVAALALSIGSVDGTADDTAVTLTTGQRVWAGAAGAPSVLPCAVGVAVLCASFSVDFYQIWIVLPREAAVAAAATTAATTTVTTTTASTATLVAVTS